jgi:glycosyltransferase involved in cell wall biosynthesis
LKISLFYITTVPWTLSHFMIGQIRYMRDKGFDVQVVSGPGAELDFLEREGIPIHPIKLTRGLAPLWDLRALVSLYCLFVRLKPIIIHGSTAKGGPLSMIAAAAAKTPIRVYTLRGLIIQLGSGLVNKVFRALEWFACRCASQVLAVSRSVEGIMIQEKLCSPDKIKVLGKGSSMGVDAENRFNPDLVTKDDIDGLRKQLGIPTDVTVLGFVGRIVRDKGVVELALAWRQLRLEYEDVFLLMIGPAEPRDPVPVEILQELRADPRVVIVDFAQNEDMPVYYRIMDLVILPTYREGFPNVPLEAAAMELPVLATRVTGCVDAVVDGVTGTLAPVRDSGALANAIRVYINDGAKRRAHGTAGRRRVISDFRPEMLWQAQYQEYVRLLREKSEIT